MEKNEIERFKDFASGFPVLASGLTENYLKRANEAFPEIAQYLEANEIPNARLEENRTLMGRVVEYAYKKLINEPFVYRIEGRDNLPKKVEEATSGFLIYNLHHVGSIVKKYDKAIKDPEVRDHPMMQAMGPLLKEAKVLFDAGAQLKLTAKKKELKSEAEREAEAKYVPPMADAKAEKLVRDALTLIAEESYHEMLESFKSGYTRDLKSALEKAQNGEKVKDFTRGEKEALGIGARNDGSYHYPKYELRDDADALILKKSTEHADFFREQFVLKNLRKLASVIDNKTKTSPLVTVEELNRKVSIGSLEGTLRITFADNSKFSVTNSVVTSESSLGKWFNRFPLRFHDAFNKDGVKMKGISEQVMNNDFR